MELEELKKKYAELGAEIERIEKGQQGRWKPEKGETYWCLYGNATASETHFTREYDENNYKMHNVFKTEEEAQSRADKIKIYWQLYDLAERLNKGEKINWKNPEQVKYNITANSKGLFTTLTYHIKGIGEIYCLNKTFLDKAIEEIRRR